MNKNNNVCNNCGKQGHLFHHCKLPITSYGIILFRKKNDEIEYLMIRRKNSFGYVDFIRGKYIQQNIEHLQGIFDEMSQNEKDDILNYSFDELWVKMWGETNNNQYKSEEYASQKKFEALKNGIIVNEKLITLEYLVKNSTTHWKETEWEFPKGRRNFQERDLECALREFEEETGYSRNDLCIIENLMPFEEIFIGSNHKAYKHKYFLAYMKNVTNNENENNYQESEVSKMEWKTLEDSLGSMRPYNLEKKQLILNINKVLQEYRLY
jgi:8-oxo-dGTP pyrophosphatase MutT (NUDIX family)